MNRIRVTDREMWEGNTNDVIVRAVELGRLPKVSHILAVERNTCYRVAEIYFKEDNMSGVDAFYDLPRDSRWLDNTYEIRGRSTDIEQLAFSLEGIIRDMFPINQVPPEFVEALNTVHFKCKEAEDEVDKFIGFVSKRKLEELKNER